MVLIVLVLSEDRLTHSPQLKTQTTPTPVSLLEVEVPGFFRFHCYMVDVMKMETFHGG